MPKIFSSDVNSITLLTHCFRPFPNWLPFYFTTCKNNPSINWVIITDQKPPENIPANVSVHKTSLSHMSKSIKDISGYDAQFSGGYKVCDWRPLFGVLFQNLIKGSTFWGHCDIDMFWGDIRKLLPDLTCVDLLSADFKPILCGPFTLYRNTDTVNNWWRESACLKKMLQCPDSILFDELLMVPCVKNAHYGIPNGHSSKNRICIDTSGVYDGNREIAFYHFRPIRELSIGIPCDSQSWCLDGARITNVN